MRGDQSGARSARTISPELTTGHALQAARDAQADQHRGQRATLLADQIPQLRQLYRAATARYAGVAVALVQAVLDGTDPHAALHAPPVPLDEASGRPTELACPGTGLPGVDADIAARHPPPVDAPAKDLSRYAAYLEDLVGAGQLRRLRLRARGNPPTTAPGVTGQAWRGAGYSGPAVTRSGLRRLRPALRGAGRG
jgi:hypothetical protein